MIGSIVRTGFLNLRRDRSALLLSFVLPIVFFSIFAVIFGGQKRGTPKVSIIVVDEDRTESSQRLVSALRKEASLDVTTALKAKGKPDADFTRETATAAVRKGDFSAALVIPSGFGANPISFGPKSAGPKIAILHDSSDPIAAQVVAGMLQKSVMMGMPFTMAESGMQYFDAAAGGLLPDQRERIKTQLAELKQFEQRDNASGTAVADSTQGGLVSFELKDVVGGNKVNPIVTFYAAGVGVMFLLFSASGAGGAILEEAESGTLDRVLSSRVNMTTLLMGKLAWLTLIGVCQLTVMFLWGAFVFKVELFSHLGGFFIMTVTSALAASALGLLLATACQTRAQLGAVSTLVILTMSALGGSMFPRFIMSETMQKVGLLTFNGWALDGYLKVFWREEPISHLWPQVLVLLLAASAFFFIARRFARRWEFS